MSIKYIDSRDYQYYCQYYSHSVTLLVLKGSRKRTAYKFYNRYILFAFCDFKFKILANDELESFLVILFSCRWRMFSNSVKPTISKFKREKQVLGKPFRTNNKLRVIECHSTGLSSLRNDIAVHYTYSNSFELAHLSPPPACLPECLAGANGFSIVRNVPCLPRGSQWVLNCYECPTNHVMIWGKVTKSVVSWPIYELFYNLMKTVVRAIIALLFRKCTMS